MFATGRVLDVSVIDATATVARYGVGGAVARLQKVGFAGFVDLARQDMRGLDVLLLFPSGIAGRGDAWIVGPIARAAGLYNSLDGAPSSTFVVTVGRRVEETLDYGIVVVPAAANRTLTIAGVEVALDTVTGGYPRIAVNGVTYTARNIEADARAVNDPFAANKTGFDLPIATFTPTGEPFSVDIPAGATTTMIARFTATRSSIGAASYRLVLAPPAAAGPGDILRAVSGAPGPMLRIRGLVTDS